MQPEQTGPSEPPGPPELPPPSDAEGSIVAVDSPHSSGHSSLVPNPLNPILTLPTDLAYETLGKIPAPILDCSNPFSILEHCTLADPTASISNSTNILPGHSPPEATNPPSQVIKIVPTPSTALNSPPPPVKTISSPVVIPPDGNRVSVFPQEANLVVDFSPSKVKVNRKAKKKCSTSYGPKTRSSKGLSSPPIVQ